MKQFVRYKNNQVLSYVEFGTQNGYPILVQHGLIASINDFALFNRLVASGARLISAARPGYGESSPYVMHTISEWGEIVSVLLAELRLSHFDVLGMSSGAPYSYALGHRFPGKVRNIYIFSGIPALYDDEVLSHWPFPVNKGATIAELQKVAYDLFFAGLSEDERMKADVKDSMRHNCFGIAQDFKMRCLDWGFRLQDVKPTVYMQHSRYDMPFITAEITSKLLPNCNFIVKDSDVHFSAVALDEFIRKVILPFYAD